MRQNKVKVAFTLDPQTYENLKSSFDERQRSAFVNQAISNELKKNSRIKLQKMIDEIKPIKCKKTSVEMIRELRHGREKYLFERHFKSSSPKKKKS
ncbi:MAG: hypothetical protein SFV53_04230 [Rickettsiales bacterium]|nr:hypothetical protein [Rickettsiales bacterium]